MWTTGHSCHAFHPQPFGPNSGSGTPSFFSMPTCFQHFCAEWRRARRVVLLHALDLETKRELAAVLAGDHVVGCDGPLAEKLAADLLSNKLVC